MARETNMFTSNYVAGANFPQDKEDVTINWVDDAGNPHTATRTGITVLQAIAFLVSVDPNLRQEMADLIIQRGARAAASVQ